MSLWVAGGALVGAIGGAVISGNASKKAAQTSADASAEAAKVIRDNYLDTKAALKPYGDAGMPALNRQQALLGLQGVDKQKAAFDQFRTSPAFEFNRSNALRDVNQQASSTGQLRSGNRLAALTDRLSGLYSQEYNNYFNQLGSNVGVGLGATTALAGVGQNAASGQAQIIQNNAANQSAATLGRAQSFASGVADIGAAFGYAGANGAFSRGGGGSYGWQGSPQINGGYYA